MESRQRQRRKVCVGSFEQEDDGREEVWLYEVKLNVCILLQQMTASSIWYGAEVACRLELDLVRLPRDRYIGGATSARKNQGMNIKPELFQKLARVRIETPC